MNIRAYGKNGDVLEKRDFGDIMRPNMALIHQLASLDMPAVRFTINGAWWGNQLKGGMYKLGKAFAELDPAVTPGESGKFFNQLKLECTDLNDGRELYLLIRSGNILPVVSFEQEQISSRVRRIRDLLRELRCAVTTVIRSRLATTKWN